MARREDIMNTIWEELDHLSDDAFMLYVWSWTNLKCGMGGIYRVARRKLIEGRFSEERLSAALAELEEDGCLFYVDGVLWCKARVKRLSMISENIAKSIVNDLKEIDPSNPLHERFVQTYGGHPKIEPLLSLNRGSESGSRSEERRASGKGRATLPGQGSGSGSLPSVNRKKVTKDEWELAGDILAAFNRHADADLTLDAHFVPLVGRIREKPEITLADHDRIIEANFAQPWWQGRPGVEVVYGSKAQFERAIEKAKGPHIVRTPPSDSPYEAKVREMAA